MDKGLINKVPSSYFKECFDYKEGSVYWKIRPLSHFSSKRQYTDFANNKAGNKVGYLEKNGYLRVKLRYEGKIYRFGVHQIVVILHDIEIPDNSYVDHINRVRHDNRIENLRLSSPLQSQRNKGLCYKNTSGYSGVFHNGFSWVATIGVESKVIWLGSYSTKEEAICKRLAAEREYFAEFSPHYVSSLEGDLK